MLTNKLNIGFECANLDQPCGISIRDRQNVVADNIVFSNDQTQTVSFDIDFPNRLFFDVLIPQGNKIQLNQIILSGLELNAHILDQICNFQPIGSDTITVTRFWNQSGTVFIDFFAQDWVQYHLLYGNKIIKS
jgi:hypothetical protein